MFDFETDGKSPQTCNVTQIACIPVDLRNLKLLPEEFFSRDVCPQELMDLGDEAYFSKHEDTINWHASMMGINPDGVLKRWKEGAPEKEAWLDFSRYIKNFCKGGRWDEKPIAGGQNIRGYDLPICERYAERWGKALDFNKRDIFDLMDLTRPWFMFHPDPPKSLSMDVLREYFGISAIGSHDAIKDVEDTAELIVKFLSLHERIAPKVKWQSTVSA